MFALTEVEIEAIRLSLTVSFWAVMGGLPLALGCAMILAGKDFYGKSLFNGLVHLPLVLPPVVIGYLLLITFGAQGWLGKPLNEFLGIKLIFTWKGAALAAGVAAFPLMVRSIWQSLEAVDKGYAAAARTLGANPFKVFITITLPLISPGLIAGAIVGFARCLGEFGSTITFVSNIPGETRTIPIAIFNQLQVPGGDEIAARLVVIAIMMSLVALLASEYLSKKYAKRLKG